MNHPYSYNNICERFSLPLTPKVQQNFKFSLLIGLTKTSKLNSAERRKERLLREQRRSPCLALAEKDQDLVDSPLGGLLLGPDVGDLVALGRYLAAQLDRLLSHDGDLLLKLAPGFRSLLDGLLLLSEKKKKNYRMKSAVKTIQFIYIRLSDLPI